MEEKKEFKCNVCNKFYKNYKSLWKHNYVYHKKENIQNIHIPENNIQNDIQNNIQNIQNNCINCNKNLSNYFSKWRHEKRCSQKNLEKENNEINKKLLEKDKEMVEFKKQMEKEIEKLKDMFQKQLKIHPKTLQKINNQLNNTGTINNITIVQLGKENLSELLTKQEKLGILNRQAMGINDIVELAHTSGKYKKCMNVYITNLQNTIGYMYDEKQNNFIAVNKNELLNDLLDSRMYDIEKFYEEFQEKIDKNKGEKIKKFIDRMNDDEDCLKGLKKEEIKLILYNSKEAISTILPKTKTLDNNEKELVI
jgi:hypothetical protein